MKKTVHICTVLLLCSGAFAQEVRKLYVRCNASFWAPGGNESSPATLFDQVAQWGGHPKPVAIATYNNWLGYSEPAFPGTAPAGLDPSVYFDYAEIFNEVSSALATTYSGEKLDFVLYSSHSQHTTDEIGGAGTEDEFVSNAVGWAQIGQEFNTNAFLVLYEPWPYPGLKSYYPSIKAAGDDYHAVTLRAQGEVHSNTTAGTARDVSNPLGWEARNWDRNLYKVFTNGVVDKHASDFGHVLAVLSTYAAVYSNSASAIYGMNPDYYRINAIGDGFLTGANGTNDIDDLMGILAVDIRSPGETNSLGEIVTMTVNDWQELARLADKLTFKGGDANLDGTVNSTDYDLVITNVGVIVSGAIWADGDFDADGDVDQDDLDILNEASGASILFDTAALSVPEGSTNGFRVKLSAAAPAGSVTVTVSRISGDTDITVQSGAILVFTTNNWNTWQSVVLAAAEDNDWLHGAAVFEASAGSCVSASLTATEADNDDDPSYTLPWTETFENDGTNAGAKGLLNGQHGWVSTGATVTNSTAQGGAQSARLSAGQMNHIFSNGTSEAWISFWAKPVYGDTGSVFSTNATAVFYINTNGNVVAYSNSTAVTLGATVSNGWNKFEVHCDYIPKVWNLSVNGVPVAGSFGFYSADQTAFSALHIVSENVNAAFVDSIAITLNDPDTGDADSDGLPNDWETQYFGSATGAVANAAAANGANTVLECYIAGLDPTDPDSVFMLSDLRSLSSENILWWNTASGRVYTVYWSSNLLSGFQLLHSNYTGGVFTDAVHGAEGQGFYRIEVRKQP